MRKISLDIKTIIIFVCVLLKYLIEYKVNTYILYTTVIVILFFQFLRLLNNIKNNNILLKIFIFFILSTISVLIYKDVNLLITYVLALTLINCDIKEFLKKFMISSSIMYIITLFLFFTGILNDNYLIRITTNGYLIRHSLGFTHPNSIFMYYIPIVLCAYIINNNKIKFYSIFSILSLILYKLSLSRTGIYCIIILFILDIFKGKLNYKKIISWLPLLFFCASYLLAIKIGISKNNDINILLSNRPYLWNKIIENGNIFTLFGSNVSNELYLDNFYLAIIYRCGLFLSLLYYFILIFGVKHINNNKIIVAIFIFMIYGLAESNTIIGSINFTLTLLLYSIIHNKLDFGVNTDDKE